MTTRITSLAKIFIAALLAVSKKIDQIGNGEAIRKETIGYLVTVAGLVAIAILFMHATKTSDPQVYLIWML
ncbi:hypothetical protein [Antrihabitans spumae]|uniref:Uncharacterized protein n=1 Tax=Antrihabitans spumae TaxID=3373370 RepID=A0ABW7JLW3_9NOCA